MILLSLSGLMIGESDTRTREGHGEPERRATSFFLVGSHTRASQLFSAKNINGLHVMLLLLDTEPTTTTYYYVLRVVGGTRRTVRRTRAATKVSPQLLLFHDTQRRRRGLLTNFLLSFFCKGKFFPSAISATPCSMQQQHVPNYCHPFHARSFSLCLTTRYSTIESILLPP